MIHNAVSCWHSPTQGGQFPITGRSNDAQAFGSMVFMLGAISMMLGRRDSSGTDSRSNPMVAMVAMLAGAIGEERGEGNSQETRSGAAGFGFFGAAWQSGEDHTERSGRRERSAAFGGFGFFGFRAWDDGGHDCSCSEHPYVQKGTVSNVWMKDHNGAANFAAAQFTAINRDGGGGGGEGGGGDGGADPLVFDLNGDGIQTLARASGKGTQVNDIAATGLAANQSYSNLGPDDGLLVFDLDKDGKRGEHGGEMFGDRTGYGGETKFNSRNEWRGVTRTPHLEVRDPVTGKVTRNETNMSKATYANGFEALKAVASKALGADAVADGKLTANEIEQLEQKIGMRLRVNNQDKTLSELGIYEINLDYQDNLDHKLADGSTIRQEGAFKRIVT